MPRSWWNRTILASGGLVVAVLVVIWTTHTAKREADSAIAASRRDAQREWEAQYQRFVYDVNRDEYAPEWKQRVLDAVKAGTDHLQAGEFTAAAAALKLELTPAGANQTVILTRAAGRTGSPENESLAELARHRVGLVLFLSAAQVPAVVEALTPHYFLGCSLKKRTISVEASGPFGSVKEPLELPPDQA